MTNEKDETNLLIRMARKLFVLRCPEASAEDKASAKAEVLVAVLAEGLAGHYAALCDEFGWPVDQQKHGELKAKVAQDLEQLEEKIKDAVENLGDSEVRDALTAKAEYVCKTGAPKQERELAFKIAEDKTVAIGHKLDMVFSQLIMSIFDGDYQHMKVLIDRCKALLEKGGDWERKNKLKVYESVYLMATRSFKEASDLLLSSVATFTTTELFPYQTLVLYTVVCCVTSLDRVTLKKKVVDSPEVLSVIGDMPHLETLLNSLYRCDYAGFFGALPGVADIIKGDMFLEPHHRYFLREIRKVVYRQFLESYKSVSLGAMAKTFGVTSAFLDAELARFVVSGDLNCKIDKVAGIVETIQPDTKNTLYQQTIKKGDVLLNRVQKLGRVIDMD